MDGGGSGRRRITVSKNGIAESSVETQIRPSPRAPRDNSTPMSSHFRGADNPNWAFTKETEKLINQQEKKMKLTSKETSDFTQNLCSRLKDIDAVADEMVSKVENMKKEMISRKEMDELTDNFSGPNRLRIVTQVKREIRKNKRILLENRELRQCLAEHQTVLEMVMNKFRRVSAHAARLERDYSTMADQNGLNEIKLENQRLTERVGDMLHVMSFAISHDNQKRKKWVDMNNKVYRLQSENANLRQMLHLSKGFGSYQPAEQNEMPPSTKKEIILENNTDNDVSSSSEDDDEDSFHEGTNQTVINGEIDFITSVIEDQLKMSGAKRSETDFIEDETSDISDVESTTSTIVNDAAISELDSELLTELKPTKEVQN